MTTTRNEVVLNKVRKEVETLMEETRKETGAFKYDWCFEAVLEIIDSKKL